MLLSVVPVSAGAKPALAADACGGYGAGAVDRRRGANMTVSSALFLGVA
jgi:hypothetical protein